MLDSPSGSWLQSQYTDQWCLGATSLPDPHPPRKGGRAPREHQTESLSFLAVRSPRTNSRGSWHARYWSPLARITWTDHCGETDEIALNGPPGLTLEQPRVSPAHTAWCWVGSGRQAQCLEHVPWVSFVRIKFKNKSKDLDVSRHSVLVSCPSAFLYPSFCFTYNVQKWHLNSFQPNFRHLATV